MSITINGKEIEVTAGETVLRAARRAGIEIPHLCSLDWAPSPSASCRLGVVEVEGAPRLQASCTLEARDGMSVRTHTPRILKARRAILELLIASHPQDCLACVRARGCELAELAGDLGVRERRYVGAVEEHAMDISSPALWRDPNKCVLCGRCVTMCHDVQGVGAIDFTGRGFRTKVAPGFSIGLNVSACVYCGQCARVCSTGAIVERNHVDAVVAALADPDAVVVAQVAPAVPATLLEGHSRSQGVHTMLERMAGALKRVGFDAVFDTSFAADVTIMEEASELLDRIQNGGALPLFTSCSPAWVHWVKTHRPDLIPHLSTCKSPQQMAGALIKEIYPHYASLGAAALAQIERRGFDVALLDHRLPNTDGLSLLYTMRERGCEAMVCMITAYASIDTAVAATRQGVDFFLPKPFTPDDLLGVVETLLRHRHARVEAERLRGEHEASLLALADEKTQTHSLVSSLRDAVLVVNREGDVVLANRAMTALLGKPEAEVLMKPAQELLGEGALAPLCEQLAAPVKDRTVKQLDIDEQSYMASIVTFRAEDGAALGRILTLSDISEVRRLATEKSRFIRMMVHELRSPLGSVKGVLEVLDDKSLG
ncbi:MAG: 2Fe-2S iron-sulfur cluster-binding protein, partial [Actinobacteria bacterium]|nr:2Fe-2S iron-sulfur cluster-binding protein [Actinomycetota bacterium]